MTDNVIAFIYLGIMLIATIYQFCSPYHETKASIYLALFYFSPLILLGLLILMNPGETRFVTHALSLLIQTTYLFNGVIHVLSIFGKEL